MSQSRQTSPNVKAWVRQYESTFNSAHIFLSKIINGQLGGFQLGTDINAHLYYEDAFFAYIKFFPLYLEFDSKFNNRIFIGTSDKASYLFREPLKNIARKHDLITSGLVTFNGYEKMYVNKGTPLVFFEDLCGLIEEVYQKLPKA